MKLQTMYHVWYIVWHQNSECTIIFLHLDCQVIVINEPFSHFFIPSVSAWTSVFFVVFFCFFEVTLCSTFFAFWFLKHLGTYSRWRLTLLRTFIFSEFFHFWVWLLLYATLSNNSNPSINPSINSDSLEAVYYWDEIK